MAYLHNIFKIIAAILDPNSDPEYLKQILKDKNFDLELLVKAGSAQLVLPAIYCHLKHKKLLQYLPEDLQAYLKEITSINRNRNITILEEATSIGELLHANQVDYVFLKGTALLISGYYKDLGERMIGDIDVLVKSDQLLKAQELLLKQGYDETETTFGFNFFEHKHLARLIPKTKLAAVEVHRKLLHKSVKNSLEPLAILQNKQLVNGLAICSDEDLLVHTVLNFQINDYGSYYNYLGLRNAHDVSILLNKIPKALVIKLLSKKYMRSFVDKMSVYFKLDVYYKKNLRNFYNTSFYILKQQYKLLNKTAYYILNIFKTLGILLHRFFIFLVNPAYRKASLNDHKRVVKLLKNHLNPF